MSLDESLSSLMGDESVATLSKKTGASKKDVSEVLNQAVPALLQSTKSKASDSKGSSVLENAFSMLEGSGDTNLSDLLKNFNISDASSLVDSILGSNGKSNLIKKITQVTGVKASSVESIINSIAPALMGALGKETKSSGESASNISGLIDQAVSGKFDLSSAASMLMSDADGDGKADGLNFLSKLFKKS